MRKLQKRHCEPRMGEILFVIARKPEELVARSDSDEANSEPGIASPLRGSQQAAQSPLLRLLRSLRSLAMTSVKISLAMTMLLFVTCYASEATDTAWSYFLKGDYRKAISEANKVEESQAHYIMGLSYIKLGRPSHARKHLCFILDMYPQIDVKEEVVLSIADSYFLEGDFQKAATEYINFLKNFQSSGLRSLAYLRLGQSQRRLGHWSTAKTSLSKVIKDFPYSFERKEAQKELLKAFYYYVQVGSFSRKANANRLLTTLQRKNFDAYINTIEKDSRTFYRVCIGKFQNRKDADVVLRKLKTNGYSAEIYP